MRLVHQPLHVLILFCAKQHTISGDGAYCHGYFLIWLSYIRYRIDSTILEFIQRRWHFSILRFDDDFKSYGTTGEAWWLVYYYIHSLRYLPIFKPAGYSRSPQLIYVIIAANAMSNTIYWPDSHGHYRALQRARFSFISAIGMLRRIMPFMYEYISADARGAVAQDVEDFSSFACFYHFIFSHALSRKKRGLRALRLLLPFSLIIWWFSDYGLLVSHAWHAWKPSGAGGC